MINKSFSKGDMLDIIRQFNLDIPNCNNMDKLKLSLTLWSHINNLDKIIPDTEIYNLNSKEELLKFLSSQNPDKILSVKDRTKLMEYCKEVIIYCNNDFNIDCCSFQTVEEIHIQTADIAIHGDIPSVRRAIKLLNKDTKLKDKIKPVISNKMRKQMNLKKSKKSKIYYGLKIKNEEFILSFD